MSPGRRWRRWLPRLVVESVVVVFSILLALVVNEWRQERTREARKERSMDAIRMELAHNYRALQEVHPYHTQLADTLRQLVNRGAESVSPGIRPRGWILPVDLVSAAWSAAQSTGTTGQFRYPVLLSVSRAYEEQSEFRRRVDGIFSAVMSMALNRGSGSLLDNPGGMAGVVYTVAQWERGLLREYEAALEGLGMKPDSVVDASYSSSRRMP